MTGNILVRGARVLDPANNIDRIADIEVKNGKIHAIGDKAKAPKNGTIVEADGLVLMPGLIDIMVRTGEPGAEHRETLQSAGEAALCGGVTSLVISPQTNPVIDDPALVDFIKRRGATQTRARIYPAGALTQGLAGERIAELGLMRAAGAVVFSNGARAVPTAALMRHALAYAHSFGALVSCRAEEASLAAGGVMNAGDFASRLGLSGIPAVAELISVQRDIALAHNTGARLLLEQISTAAALDAVRRAKARGVAVYCSVSIHHLTLNEMDVGDYRTFAHLSPPLRAEDDRKALLAGLADGSIDAIVSGHDPRPAEDKRLPFAQSAPGAVGLETLLPGILSLVHSGEADLRDVVRLTTASPAKLMGISGGTLAMGAPADFTLVDMDVPWVCDADSLRSKSKNTPYDERRMQGRAVMTFVGGEKCYDAGKASPK